MKKEGYGIIHNFCYILKKQWEFGRTSIWVQGIRVFLGVFVSLVNIWITKIVLDALEKGVRIEIFLFQFIPVVILLALLTWINHSSDVYVKRFADCMRYDCYVKLINDLAIREDYSSYISPEGKNRRQKAELSVGDSGESGINGFFSYIVELLKNACGLFSYCMILFLLNPFIILLHQFTTFEIS